MTHHINLHKIIDKIIYEKQETTIENIIKIFEKYLDESERVSKYKNLILEYLDDSIKLCNEEKEVYICSVDYCNKCIYDNSMYKETDFMYVEKDLISILNHTGYDVLCKNCNEMTTYYECKECHNVTCYCGCINGINNCRCKPIGQRELNLYPYYFKGMYILDSPSVDYGCRYCDKDVKKREKYTINIDNDKFKIINTGNFEEYKIDSKKLKNHYLANIRCKYCDKTHMDYESWL